MIVKRTLKKTLERLGVKYSEIIIGWKKTPFGKRPQFGFFISESDWKQIVEPDRKRTEEKRNKANSQARKKRWDDLNELANNLGVLPDSRTLAAFRRGEISEEEAKRIGEITAFRHEETEYEDLLRSGVSKEDARAMIPRFVKEKEDE